MIDSFRKNITLLKDRKKGLLVIVLALMAASFFEMLGIGLIGPFVLSITNDEYLDNIPGFGIYYYQMRQWFGFTSIEMLSVLLITTFLIKNIIGYLLQRKIISFSYGLQCYLMQKLMRAYQYAPYEFHLSRNSASLIQAINANTGAYIHTNLIPLLRLVADSVLFIMISLFLVFKYPLVTFILLLVVGGFGLIYVTILKERILSHGNDAVDVAKDITKTINHAMRGLKEIRVYGKEKYFLETVRSKANQYSNVNAKLASAVVIPKFILEWLIILLIVILTIYYLANYSSEEVFVLISTLGVAAARLMPAATQIISNITNIRFSTAALDVVYNDLQSASTNNIKEGCNFNGTVKPYDEFKQIHMDNISFQYENSSDYVVKNINIQIKKGDVVGIVGKSGSGKSTLVDIMLGLLNPQKGVVNYNGNNIRTDNACSWLHHVAYIQQSSFLLDDSLSVNITLGDNNKEIDQSRLSKSIQMAQLEELVDSLPQGLETEIGEWGGRLSGGQRQRIALARAFYHKKSVIIMDEATSALDVKTERDVVDAINSLKGNYTIVMIAHRITTLEPCDIIYRMEKGEVRDTMTYEQLLKIESGSNSSI